MLAVDYSAVPVVVTQKSKRSSSAWFDPEEGVIKVILSNRLPKAEAEKVAATLVERVRKKLVRRIRVPPRRRVYEDGEAIRSGGKWLILSIKETEFRKHPAARIEGSTLLVVLPSGMHYQTQRRAVSALIREHWAKSEYARLLLLADEISRKYFNAETPIEDVEITRQNTRWANICRDRIVRLSVRALFLPKDLLEYLMVHELAHLKAGLHAQHGPGYRRALAEAEPDWRKKERELAVWSHIVPVHD
ncbi:Uncharacterised protein [uncultured archaeon]|nr:Uncharacterised protein [uncultured archaeon]